MTAKSRIRAPYDVLCRVIGNPMHRARPSERVAWDVDVDGAQARVHDHPDDKPVGTGLSIFESPHAIWHVEAKDDEQLAWICNRVSERVIEAVAKATGARTLTADDKAAVNRMLKTGISLGEAMKRVQMQSDDARARSLYGWPMKDAVAGFGATLESAVASAAPAEDDDDGDDEKAPASSTSAAPSTSAPPEKSAAKSAAPKKTVAVGPPMPADLPRASFDAPFAAMVALLGEPEDRPIPFVSTRWRFVLDEKRASPVVRWEDEPSDDPRDVDASVFDRISRFDEPYGARTAKSASWTVTSSSSEHLERVLAWLHTKVTGS